MSAVGANKTNFDIGGRGPSDSIAFPNIYQVFGDDAKNQIENMKKLIPQWAESQAKNGLNAKALQKIFEVQADLIIKHKGKQRSDGYWTFAVVEVIVCDIAPVVEMIFFTGYPADLGINMWPLLPFSRGNVKITVRADSTVCPFPTCQSYSHCAR